MRPFLPLVLSLVVGCQPPPNAAAPERLVDDEVARAERDAPELTLREFLRAFLDQDEPALRRLTVDCPDRAQLWSFGHPIMHADRRRDFLESTMRRVAVGETVYLPAPEDLRAVLMDEAMINDGRAVILLDDNRLLPWLLVRTGGKWRVDPYAFVVAIKSGREFEEREQREQREQRQRRGGHGV
jgi:hypothetical protein